jgi:hypothetical protein
MGHESKSTGVYLDFPAPFDSAPFDSAPFDSAPFDSAQGASSIVG